MDQDEAHHASLRPVATELVSPGLLQHKDAGVRAWACCCLVDMLRLFAPDAPFPAKTLKEIFSVIITKLLPLLADPSHPYNSQHLYVLRSLAEWKSILLINDLPGADALTTALFTACFDVLAGPAKHDGPEELSQNVEHNMTDVLSTVIDEAAALPHDVVDIIVAQFLWADPIALGSSKPKKSAPVVDARQTTLRRKDAPPAYNMAKSVCNSNQDKMARLVGNYFSSVIVDFTNSGPSFRRARAGSEDAESAAAKGPSDDDLNEASKAHRLLRELWKCAPGVLQDIVPHLVDELGTENVQLRQLATETLGDMISGIGAAGPPPPPQMDPSAYPSQSLSRSDAQQPFDFLTTPTSISSFPTQHPVAYHSFLQRKNDKSPIIRASWTTAIGRILTTSAGGIGLDPEEEQNLLKSFAECLIDSDERVRLAAVKAVELFSFDDIVRRLGSNGNMTAPGSILSNLADRVKDKKSIIHSETTRLIGRIWGVASGAIAEGDENVSNLLGSIPSRILEAFYVNDADINVQIDTALFESLLPLGYPPMKPRAITNGASQVIKDSQTNGDQGFTEAELDKLRTERQLVLVNGLSERAKKVYFAKQGNQVKNALTMEASLQLFEKYNGGVINKEDKDIKSKLSGLIAYFAGTLPEPAKTTEELWKFAKAHDRRAYALIRFCMDPASDYRRVFKSIKELRKRIEDGPGATLLDVINPLLYRMALLCYNKSHVSAIIGYTRTDDKGLGAVAHELLKEISLRHPKVFSTHVKDLCRTLESEAPTAKTPNPPGAVDDLKACAAFAKKFPSDIPMNTKDGRKLVQSFLNFSQYGTPAQAAKHAITIVMHSDNKKELHAKEILDKSIKNFKYNGDHWLTNLAALSQLVLLAQTECEDSMDSIIEIAIEKVLHEPHLTTEEADVEWMDVPDDDILGRAWALKVLINRLRSLPSDADLDEAAISTYALLNRLVKDNGEASESNDTPAGHKSRQRLLAANALLKLSTNKRLDALLKPADFVQLALVTHDPCPQVRRLFAEKLMKYLGQNRLPPRFYTILFFFAHEPERSVKESTLTWIRSRRAAFAARKETVLETVFSRLLSLLAHHPDFDTEPETLKLMSEYILYYLKCVATEDNLSLIFHVAQRVKGVADNIAPSQQADENLYVLSDLSQALVRSWEEQNSWTMQSWPGKMRLPSGIFRALESHERAQEIAKKTWIDEDLVEDLDPLVRKAIRTKKRKATDGVESARKKKSKGDRPRKEKKERPIKTPRKKHVASDDDAESDDGQLAPETEPKRKSGRHSNVGKSYVEVSSDDEDINIGAESVEQVEEQDVTEEEERESTSEPEVDVEMADADKAESDEEPEAGETTAIPEPDPPKRGARGRAAKAKNAAESSPPAQKRKTATSTKAATPAKVASVKTSSVKDPTPVKADKATNPVLKGKAKVNGAGEAKKSSPPTNGTSTRRSARTKS
ncbi:armadillo-type protein [Boeremia exigua]|uniref:armadillo-type protein n=1 Tax=Boeremia exigua TaxID=749465 RepID=UPI001E8DBBE2|nr:armadillo-type protein [Boeremia exigua]KAH6625811.1 armadillo-type protein [Boeremia exigua]